MGSITFILILAVELGLLVISARIFLRKGWHWKVASATLFLLAFVMFVGFAWLAAPI